MRYFGISLAALLVAATASAAQTKCSRVATPGNVPDSQRTVVRNCEIIVEQGDTLYDIARALSRHPSADVTWP